MTPGLTWGTICACAWATNSDTTAKPSVRGASRIEDRTRPIAGHRSADRLGGMLLLTIGNRGEIATVEVFHRRPVDMPRAVFTALARYQQALDVHGRAVADDFDRAM